jgi:Asp/Glu/hydantoin racemase
MESLRDKSKGSVMNKVDDDHKKIENIETEIREVKALLEKLIEKKNEKENN